MIDPVPVAVAELLAVGAVTSLAADRVRGREAAPGDGQKPWQPFVVVSVTFTLRRRRVPVQDVTLLARCFGSGSEEAAALAAAVSDAWHDAGPRIGLEQVGIYNSADIGETPAEDPNTGQPFVDVQAEMILTTQALA